MLSETLRRDLSREVADLARLPQAGKIKTWWRPRKHIRAVRLGKARVPVILKAYCDDKRRWESSCQAEYEVLQVLKDGTAGDGSLRFPELICLLEEQQQVLAMTRLSGRSLAYLVYVYGIMRLRTAKLLEWSRLLGRGIADFQRAHASPNGAALRDRDISEDQVRTRTVRVPVLVEAGLDRVVCESPGLLREAPRSLAHCDLSVQNILVHRDQFGLLDWEYAGIRTVFHDPLHLGLSLLITQRRGVPFSTASAMAETLLRSWLEAARLPFSRGDLRKLATLELCHLYCLDGYHERIVSVWPRFAAQLVDIVGGL